METEFLDRNKKHPNIQKTQPKPCEVETKTSLFLPLQNHDFTGRRGGDFILRLQSSKLCLWPGSTLQSYLGESTPLGDESFGPHPVHCGWGDCKNRIKRQTRNHEILQDNRITIGVNYIGSETSNSYGTVYPILKVAGKFQHKNITTIQCFLLPSRIPPGESSPRWWAALQDAGGTLPALSTRHPRFGGVDGAEDGFVSHDRPKSFRGGEGKKRACFYGECFCVFFFWCVLNESLDECVLSCLFVAMSWRYSFCGDGVSTWTCMDTKFCIVSHCTKLNACAVGALFIRMISIYYSEGFFSEPPPTFLQVAYYLSQASLGREKNTSRS